RLNAPEETGDYRPPHAPLTSVDELKKVFGWAQYTPHPGWDEDFTTIIGGCQHIDAAYASRDVLRALGIPDDFVDRVLQARRWPSSSVQLEGALTSRPGCHRFSSFQLLTAGILCARPRPRRCPPVSLRRATEVEAKSLREQPSKTVRGQFANCKHWKKQCRYSL